MWWVPGWGEVTARFAPISDGVGELRGRQGISLVRPLGSRFAAAISSLHDWSPSTHLAFLPQLECIFPRIKKIVKSLLINKPSKLTINYKSIKFIFNTFIKSKKKKKFIDL
jgi:hypothetical protein